MLKVLFRFSLSDSIKNLEVITKEPLNGYYDFGRTINQSYSASKLQPLSISQNGFYAFRISCSAGAIRLWIPISSGDTLNIKVETQNKQPTIAVEGSNKAGVEELNDTLSNIGITVNDLIDS